MNVDLEAMGLELWIYPIVAVVVLFVVTALFLASRYRRCSSDMILVVFGKVGKGQSAKCLHGGGTLVWPLIQDYAYMSLTPITMSIPLTKALSRQNIRVNVPSTFTVGISIDPEVMNNAAERLLNLKQGEIEEMAREIIFGQLRLTVASLSIEEINQDRERFLDAIRTNVSPELNKIGLYLINVNITDITDESEYIESIGKKAASEAVNQAKIDVAVQDKSGAIGQSDAVREQEIRVAENLAAAEKGKKQAEADKRVYVQAQETRAKVGEADALRVMEIKVAENEAGSDKGRKKAEADKRIYLAQQEAEAVTGENDAKVLMADSNAALAVKQAEALRVGEVAKRVAMAEIQKSQYAVEQTRLMAEVVAAEEVERKKIEIAAGATAEKARLEAQGEADAILLQYEAEAKGIRQVLDSKAAGYQSLIQSCNGDAKAAATLLMTEKIVEIVQAQVEAIKGVKIDKITVWDSASSGEKTATANFLSGLIKSLPPLHDVASMAGVELPQYLGEMIVDKKNKES